MSAITNGVEAQEWLEARAVERGCFIHQDTSLDAFFGYHFPTELEIDEQNHHSVDGTNMVTRMQTKGLVDLVKDTGTRFILSLTSFPGRVWCWAPVAG